MWSFKKREFVGIDIDSAAIKLLVLGHDKQGLMVKNFACVTLPVGAVVNKKIKQAEKVTAAIQQALQLAECKASKAIIALPISSVMTKVIEMDVKLTDAELEEEIEFEIEKHISHPLENLNFDFHVLGSANDPKKINVLLVATLLTNVQERIKCLANAGLDVEIVDVESFARERGIKRDEKCIAIFDINSDTLSLVVSFNSHIIYTYEEALNDDEPTKVIAQIKRYLQFYAASSLHNQIDYILLGGNALIIASITHELEKQLNISIKVADPLKFISYSHRHDAKFLTKNSSSLMTVAGLALRGVAACSS